MPVRTFTRTFNRPPRTPESILPSAPKIKRSLAGACLTSTAGELIGVRWEEIDDSPAYAVGCVATAVRFIVTKAPGFGRPATPIAVRAGREFPILAS